MLMIEPSFSRDLSRITYNEKIRCMHNSQSAYRTIFEWKALAEISSAANNFIRKGPVNEVVSHCRRLESDYSLRSFSNRWKLIKITSKNISKFVSEGDHGFFSLILAAPLAEMFPYFVPNSRLSCFWQTWFDYSRLNIPRVLKRLMSEQLLYLAGAEFATSFVYLSVDLTTCYYSTGSAAHTGVAQA